MKKIKFRAWDKLNSEMLQVSKLDIINGEVEFEYGDTLESKDIDLMQYTGLKDKNDIEIYEGDIIKVDDQSKSYQVQEVVFKDGMFCGYSEKKSCPWTSLDVLIRAYKIEVTGNVH